MDEIKLVKSEDINGVTYSYYSDGSYRTYKELSDYQYTTASYDKNGTITSKFVSYSEDHSIQTEYSNGLPVECREWIDDNDYRTTYNYDENNHLTSEEKYRILENEAGLGVENLIGSKKYQDSKVISGDEYTYYPNGNVKSHVVQKQNGGLNNIVITSYDENGNATVTNDFYDGDKLLTRLNKNISKVEYNEESGLYEFYYGKNVVHTIDKQGNKVYYNDYITKIGLFSDSDFNLYNPVTKEYYENIGDHVMYKLGELDDGKWIVSTWGDKWIYEPNNPENMLFDSEAYPPVEF